uniref:Chromodomain-helicase-DNA-binding protein 6-like n=1 Tax=Sinocyclocheilus rhinocerous TaxID=307959 RepID=A0A673LAN5_9TELE
MCVCMYVCMYACMRVCVYIYIYIYLGKEQLRIIGGPPNHCMAHPKHSGLREAGSAASSHSLRPLSINSEEDDGGGGARVKKKRRKKDKKESEWHKNEESNAKPKRREQKEAKELLPRKSKVAKEQKDHKKREPKAQKEVKKVKKGQDVKVKTQAKNTATHPRSGRQVKRRKYNEDLDFKVVDDDGETIAVLGSGRIAAMSSSTLAWQAEEPPEDEANIIEKILSARTVKKEVTMEEMEEFYVKYRNFSYLHCKWATLEELEKDPRIGQKIKRFRNKQAQMKHIFTEPDEDLFNPDYIEVDRVLEIAITTDTETGEEVTHYLVKWCSLSYEESTWELQEDVDPVKIREFEDLKEIPDIKHVERPLPEQWQKLEKSREYRNGNQLREYQLEGMNWLLFNWYNRKNCILADEMGLGKTIQSITFLYEIYLMDLRGPFLIIAPLSTITNWEREFRTWTEINVIVYHGSQISRQMILQYEMYHRDEQGNIVSGQFKFHGIITTFEMIMADCPELKKINWRCVVIDEAHRLKNRNCKLLEGLKLMNLEHKVLLTGTPLQNSVEELFSLLNFLEPSQFPSETTFLEEFGDLKTEEQVKKLQAILKPMMLRRLKDDVEKNLAPKEETIIEVELTNIQKKYYRAILEKNFAFLAKGANQHNMPNLINTMMELRKCCNHPYLITGAEEKILESFKKTYSSDAIDFQLQAMIQAAGKLVLIDKLLPKLLAGGHKVLVFSQMVRCLDILEDYLIQRRYTYERIDGRVRGNLRQAAIDRFSKVDSDRFVFLLCTRAGGLGINLTAADTCIIFDSDWNPQNDLQAQARCHRIGQSKAVKVYRLITRNSYEREMFDKASLKLGLDKAVLQDINRKGSINGVQQLSKMEVEDLLRKGAYGALMDEEDEGSKFCEEDIDQILQRRTQTITIQSEGKGSTFAKASFVSSGNRTDISLDDPNFWQKWAKIAELEIDSKAEKESLVIDTPRVRKQTRHYNSFEDDELMEFSELDSDSEERPCRTRRLSDRNRRYLRAECFRVEKNLLIFGWGRWKDILNHGRFKWHLTERDMEVLCRALLVYCVRHYKGDDKIKSFIWDLITPTKDGHNQALQNHSGLSAPVPRGRKGKKLKNQLSPPELKNADWLVHCNPEVVLQDDSYKKHLKQHCNKVLLRVRMLYYLKVEVLGEAANQALEGIPASKLEVTLPDIDYIEIPTIWWDAEADKSLLIGVHKHGYERYNAMRADPALCFLERVGMPDVTALTVDSISFEGGFIGSLAADLVAEVMEQGRIQWPVGSALTARLRRLITAYQRYTRREPLRHDFLLHEGIAPVAWQIGEFRHCTTEPDPLFLEWQRRWTRREQADFNRTVSSFGVVYDQEKKTLDWSQFRALARLERKTDESLERYFHSFVSVCRTACRLPPRKDEGNVDPSLFVEPITEERAARTLYRIELLRKVREQVLRHPLLGARLQLCRPSLYLPVWWECGKHDRDLLIGVAKHGLSRTDFYILNDPQLSFLEAHRNYVHKENHRYPVPGLPHHHCCLYDANLGHCQSPQPPEYHPTPSHHTPTQLVHSHGHHQPTEVVASESGSSLGIGTGIREGFLDCPPLDDSLELGSLQHEGLTSDTLHSKSGKEAFNGFPFNSATGGQNMLNSYGVQGELNGSQGDMADSIAGKLRSDVLVGEQGSSEETGLMAPSVELDELQTPWESSDHAEASDMFNETDPILGAQTLEPSFLDAPQPEDGHEGDETLTDCLSMPSSDSQSNPIEPLAPSFMLFKDLNVGETSVDQTDLSASLPEYVPPPPPLGLTDVSLDQTDPISEEQEDKLSDSSITHGVPSPEEGAESIGFQDLSPDSPKTMDTQDELPSIASQIENCLEESQKGDYKVPFEDSNGDLKDPCEVALDEPYEKPLTEPEKVPLEESYDLTCDETLQEPCEGFQQDTAEQQLVEEPCKEPSEPIEECNLTNTTLSTDYPMPPSLPSSPTTLPDTSESPGLDAVPKQELLMDPVVSDMADSVHEIREPTIAQLLQEKALFSFSEWPKDRVIINRIDSICHTILKGKWPSSSQQYESPTSLANTCVPSSAHQRAGFLSTRMPISQSFSRLAPVFLPELKRPRRGFEFEAEVLAKPSNLGEKIQVGVPHRANALLLNGWQDAAIDLSKPTELTAGGDSGPIGQMSHTVQSAPHKITGIGSIQGSLGLDMAGILQAGLIHPVTGQIVNGGLHRDDSMLRRRKGRRRNVETPDLMFCLSLYTPQSGSESISHPVVSSTSSQSEGPPATPTTLPTHPPASEAMNVSLDRETANKGLMEWLRQNPNYNMDMLHSFLERPKQRRHRCKDPTKLDVNSLTGEERVPVVHRNTGRRGFLPEGKFTRILSGPVCRDPGPRRRGRRPRSEMPKAHELPAGMGPLFMNGGLIGSMDLVSLPNLRNVPGIPLTGIMGFPHGFATAIPSGDDAKNGLSMLPMMLHGMAAVQPPMYSAHMSGMMNQPLSTAASTTSTATASSTTASVTSMNSGTVTSSSNPADSSDFAPQHDNASSPMSMENGNMEDAKQGGEEKKVSASVSTAVATSSSSSSITSTGSHLTFNPFLIPGMSHSLLYPHMFLPPGSIMALPAMTAADSTGSPKRKRKKVREEGPEEGSSNVGVHIDGVESKEVKDEQTPEQKSQEGGMEEGRPDVDLAPVKNPSEDRSTEEKDKNEMGEEPRPNAQGLCDSGD